MSSSQRRRLSRHKVPVVLVGGIQEAAMMATSISLQFGLPDSIAVRHTIDPERQLLTRTVSDLSGVVEREEINLAHACVSCAIREDIVPTLERLAAQGRWGSIVACLPVAAEAVQVCRVLGWAPRNAPHVSIAAVVAALDGSTVAEDLLGDDLLDERGLATAEDDRRGVAEVACAMVEYADVTCLSEPTSRDERSLLVALARPGVPLVEDPSLLDLDLSRGGQRRHLDAEGWMAEVRRGPLPPLSGSGVWRLDLCSERPFHPLRLHEDVAALGSGPHRSRGCFWLPTRSEHICAWEGAGGQVSVGSTQKWGPRQAPLTRLIVVGLDDASTERAEIADAFHRCLLTDEELSTRGHVWEETWDGLEPWLGPINHAA